MMKQIRLSLGTHERHAFGFEKRFERRVDRAGLGRDLEDAASMAVVRPQDDRKRRDLLGERRLLAVLLAPAGMDEDGAGEIGLLRARKRVVGRKRMRGRLV